MKLKIKQSLGKRPSKDWKDARFNIRMNIKTKIFTAFGIGLIFLLMVSGLSVVFMSSINSDFKTMADVNTPGIKAIDDLSITIIEYRRQELTFITTDDKKKLNSIDGKLVLNKTKINTIVSEYAEKYAKSDDEKNSFNLVKSNLEKYMKSSEEAMAAAKSGDKKYADQFVIDSESFFNTIQTTLSIFTTASYEKIKVQSVTVNKNFNMIRLVLIISAALFGFISVGLGLWISTSISKPVIKLQKLAKSIASGDLTIDSMKVMNKDEIGDLTESFNVMLKELKSIVKNVNLNAEQVAASAGELSASVEQTAKATEEISKSVEEVTSGVEEQGKEVDNVLLTFDEMNKGLMKMADNIGGSTNIAMKTAQDASDGEKVIKNAVNHMVDISQKVKMILNTMEELKNKSNSIESIISVISDISKRTNLLALNAAIEAARAGESGRGFAVVADEVKKLASQSNSAAAEIEKIISTVKSDINNAESVTKNGARAVEDGLKVIIGAGETFKTIVSGIEKVAMQSKEVVATSIEMASRSEKVKEAIDKTSQISMDTAISMETVAASAQEQLASMQQIAALAQSLNNMSIELGGIIGKFKV